MTTNTGEYDKQKKAAEVASEKMHDIVDDMLRTGEKCCERCKSVHGCLGKPDTYGEVACPCHTTDLQEKTNI